LRALAGANHRLLDGLQLQWPEADNWLLAEGQSEKRRRAENRGDLDYHPTILAVRLRVGDMSAGLSGQNGMYRSSAREKRCTADRQQVT